MSGRPQKNGNTPPMNLKHPNPDLTETEELKLLTNLKLEAQEYLRGHPWCIEILNSWVDMNYSFYDKLGIFLFHIKPKSKDIDEFIWVVCGDLPTVYLDQSLESSKEVLMRYCDLMEEWSNSILKNTSIEECYPVEAEANEENANILLSRINFIKKEVLNN